MGLFRVRVSINAYKDVEVWAESADDAVQSVVERWGEGDLSISQNDEYDIDTESVEEVRE